MRACDVAEADTLLRIIRDLDKMLAAGTRQGVAQLSVVTNSSAGQDFSTAIRLPAANWRFALTGYRMELVDRLTAMGVEMT